MIFFQLLGVGISGAFALVFLLLVIGPALGGIIHGRRFTIEWWHALVAGVASAVTVWQLVAYGVIEVSS